MSHQRGWSHLLILTGIMLAATLLSCGGGGGGSTSSSQAPAITSQPSNTTVTEGQSAAFTVAASGQPAPTYQWERSADGTIWSAITGATSATYTFTVQAADDGARFRAKATNSVGSATSSAAALTVNTHPLITTQPADQTVSAGQQASFTVTATGRPASSYQWQRSNDGGTTWADVPSATSASFTFTAQAADDGAQFRAKATNSVGSATSNAAALTVNTIPLITTQPADQTVSAGQQASFSVAASGKPVPSYQWQRSNDGGTTWAAIPGAIQPAYAFSTQVIDHGARFRALASNSAGATTSNAAVLAVNAPPSFGLQPTSQTVTAGQHATFSAIVIGTPTLTFQWQRSGDGGITWTNIPSATSSTYSLTAQIPDRRLQFRIRAANSLGSITSNVVQVQLRTWLAGKGAHSLLLKPDGTVRTWGANWAQQSVPGLPIPAISSPIVLNDLNNIVAVAGGWGHSLALKGDGTVWAWGGNFYGQIGTGGIDTPSPLSQVVGLNNIVAISAGDDHSLAVKSDGTVWAWGRNHYGQLGDGTTLDQSTPVQVPGLIDIIALAGGGFHSLALKADGTLWAWGSNEYGQLGDGTINIQQTTPVQVAGMNGIVAMAGGYLHSMALGSDGKVWTWGFNGFGQLGDGTQSSSPLPIQVPGLADVTAIAAGDSHGMAKKADGTLWTWGENPSGQLGDGTITNQPAPIQVKPSTA